MSEQDDAPEETTPEPDPNVLTVTLGGVRFGIRKGSPFTSAAVPFESVGLTALDVYAPPTLTVHL